MQPRVALVHDYLIDRGGAERVLLAMSRVFPEAPIFTSVYRSNTTLDEFREMDVRPLWTSRLPSDKRSYRALVAAYALAFDRLPLAEFDVALSNTTGFAKSAGRSAKGRAVLCHTPPRFVWPCGDSSIPANAAEAAGAAMMRPWLRRLDLRAAARVDVFAANSENVQRRIKRFYGRDSVVIHPPLDLNRFPLSGAQRRGYLVVGRLKAYKGIREILHAFAADKSRPLDVVGIGPDDQEFRTVASSNVTFRGYLSDSEVALGYGAAKALIVSGEEDWGMTPLEANACGTPVVAAARGGSLESVIDGVNGVLFDPNDPWGLLGALRRLDGLTFKPEDLRRHAESYREEVFREKISELVNAALEGASRVGRHR